MNEKPKDIDEIVEGNRDLILALIEGHVQDRKKASDPYLLLNDFDEKIESAIRTAISEASAMKDKRIKELEKLEDMTTAFFEEFPEYAVEMQAFCADNDFNPQSKLKTDNERLRELLLELCNKIDADDDYALCSEEDAEKHNCGFCRVIHKIKNESRKALAENTQAEEEG